MFQALSTLEGLASFWTPVVGGSPEVGGSLSFGFSAAPVDLRMTVTDSEPDTRVTWECTGPWPHWAETRVSWTLSPSETGTMVVFRHDGWEDAVTDAELGSVALTWAMTLQALKAYAETGAPAPALN